MARLVEPVEHAEPCLDLPMRSPDDNDVGTVSLDRHLITCRQPGVRQHLDRQRDLVLAGDTRHAFTIS